MKDAGQATIDALKTLSPKRLRNSRDHESPSGSKSERASRRSRRPRSRTQPPAELPPLELSEEDFLKEWGITKDQEVHLRLRDILICSSHNSIHDRCMHDSHIGHTSTDTHLPIACRKSN